MSKHTPGPWKAENWGGIHTKIRAGDDDMFVATVTGGIAAQSGPNARLIAAAPDLLAALKLCEPFCKGHQETPEKVARYAAVCAAIAKAEGTS